MTKYISPFNFREYLDYLRIPYTKNALYLNQNIGQVRGKVGDYLQFGGLPEAINLVDKRNYLTNIYQNVFLADIVVRNNIRNKEGLSLLIKKLLRLLCIKYPIHLFTKQLNQLLVRQVEMQ